MTVAERNSRRQKHKIRYGGQPVCKICCLGSTTHPLHVVQCVSCVNLILHKISAKLTLTSGLRKMINALLTPALDSCQPTTRLDVILYRLPPVIFAASVQWLVHQSRSHNLGLVGRRIMLRCASGVLGFGLSSSSRRLGRWLGRCGKRPNASNFLVISAVMRFTCGGAVDGGE